MEQESASRRNGIGFAAAVTVVNFGSFLFHLMLARTFDPALLGQVAALLSLMVLFQVPANAVEVLVARGVATSHSGSAEARVPALGALLALAALASLGVGLVVLALAPALQQFLHLPTLATAMLVAAYALPVAIGAVPKGLLFGEGRYLALGAALVSGSGAQLVIGTVLVHGGRGAEGAIAAMVAGEVLTAAVLVTALRGKWAASDTETAPLGITQAVAPAAAYAAFWLLSVVDVLLIQHLRPGTDAGAYAAATIAAQIALFAPGAVAARAFTRFLRSKAGHPRSRIVLLRATGAVVAVSAAIAIVVFLIAAQWISLLYAGAFPAAAGIVGRLAISGGCVSLVSLLLQYQLAEGRRLAPLPCAFGLVAIVTGIDAQHRTIADVADWTLVSTAGTALVMLVVALAGARIPTTPVVEEASLALLDADLDLTVVVPYYNPGELLAGNIARLIEVLDASDRSFEVIAVCDGSTDGSERYIDEIRDPRLVHVVLSHNQGKGAALRIGLGQGRGRWLGFIDADGDLDPYLFEPFLVLTNLYSPEIILGSKKHPLSEVEYPTIRRLYSGGYRKLTHALFSLDVSDTQTGIKLIRRDVLAAVLPRMIEKRFAFDLELFVIARRLGYRRFLEAPVRLRHQFTSTVSFKAVRRTLRDTMAIAYRLRVLRVYDEPRGAASRDEASIQLDVVGIRGAIGSSKLRPARR